MDSSLEQQLALVLELDQLKRVERRTKVASAGNRQENSAEHSWHVATMALLMEQHANQPVAIDKVIKMLLLHDIVEIDAGDTFLYDAAANLEQEAKERVAAQRLFGLLPKEQGDALLQLWQEFESAETAEARFAKALDRFIPMMLNFHNQGQSWIENGVTKEQVLTMNRRIADGSTALWTQAQQMIDQAADNGWLKV